MGLHHHDHDHEGGRGHHHGAGGTRTFAIITLVNLAYTVLEAGYGFATNSLALLSDALHNLGDVLGLGLAWAAAVVAKRPTSPRHTYGWRRATLLSPLANALVLVGFSGALAWEAIGRFGAPPQVPGLPVMAVAAIGIGVNLGAAWLVRDGHAHDLNRRGAFLHLMADAAVSLAAVLAGAGMVWLGWSWLDPATALVVGAVIAVGAFGLLRRSRIVLALVFAPALAGGGHALGGHRQGQKPQLGGCAPSQSARCDHARTKHRSGAAADEPGSGQGRSRSPLPPVPGPCTRLQLPVLSPWSRGGVGVLRTGQRVRHAARHGACRRQTTEGLGHCAGAWTHRGMG